MILRCLPRACLGLILLFLLGLPGWEARAERKVKVEAKSNQPLVSPAKPMVTGDKALSAAAPSQRLSTAAADKPLAAAVATNTLAGAQALHGAKNYAAAIAACDRRWPAGPASWSGI